jgi:hypothetical protein
MFIKDHRYARKSFIPTILRLLYDVSSLKNDVNVSSKSKKQQKIFFVAVLKGADENSRFQIRIWSQIRESEVRIHGFGSESVPKSHGGFATLGKT